MPNPPPLALDTVLIDRFRILQVLGRGGFGIAYVADDRVRQDQVVVKELAPEGTHRQGGILDLGNDGPRLRSRFLEEARLVSKLTGPGILPVRCAFADCGTSYFATPFLPHARTLQAIIDQEGSLPESGALDIFFQLLESLEHVHNQGFLHRDIKPSNILIDRDGRAYLIDFGAAREWYADASHTQTVTYTPGYAPPEQLSEKARRGPPSDLYGLFATLHHMLAGEPPSPVGERIAHQQVRPPLDSLVVLDPALRHAMERGLSLVYGERPQSVLEARDLLAGLEEDVPPSQIEILDDLLARSRAFRSEPRACPACDGGILQEPRPLRPNICPVCHQAPIAARRIEERLCPTCRAGALHRLESPLPIAVCPECDLGRLVVRKRSILGGNRYVLCEGCGTEFGLSENGLSRDGVTQSFEEWRGSRSAEIWQCDGCQDQFDVRADGQRRRRSDGRTRFPYEWALIAAGLDPGDGNAECPQCGADYDIAGDTLTLLKALEDPHGFAAAFRGRRLSRSDVRWLAVGKESPQPGYVCDSCGTELDRTADFLCLVRASNARLRRMEGQLRKLEDWHRIAKGLPEIAEEEALWARLDEAIRASYREGAIGFNGDSDLAWQGPAVRAYSGDSGTLTVAADSLTFGKLLRRWRVPRHAVASCVAEGDELVLSVHGERDTIRIAVSPMEMTVRLKVGNRSVVLDAHDLQARLAATS